MKKTILFMDNDAGFLEVHSRLLRQAGYEVLKASSIAEATALLAEQFVQLAILDVRMEDDRDPQDISGLKLAEAKAHQTIPKIMLTAYLSKEYAEKALGAILEGLEIKGMVNKADGPDTLLQAVEKAFTHHVFVNDQLVIHWNERKRLSFAYFITLLEPQLAAEDLPLRTNELEALFRQLFPDSHQVTISQLFKQGESDLFIGLSAYNTLGRESQYVVACSLKRVMANARKQHQDRLPQASPAGSLVVERTTETTRFAATAYSLTGADMAEFVNFAAFYQYQSVERIINVLDHLFETTLHAWYSKGQSYEIQKTTDTFFSVWLGLESSQAKLAKRVQSICREIMDNGLAGIALLPHQLQWQLLPERSEVYPNPVSFLYRKQPAFVPPYLCGTTHGQLNGDSILISPEGQTWLIDFSQMAQGPLVRDFVALETAVKFDLMSAHDIETVYQVEKRLLAASRLSEALDSSDLEPSLQKAIEIISCIRHHAAKVIGQEIEHYFGGLYFYAVARLTTYNPDVRHTRHELIPTLHALLSAALICQRLTPLSGQNLSSKNLPSQAVYGLWIGENGEVWVENQNIPLTPREFDLLDYLYQRKGELCSRLDIAKSVFDAVLDPALSDWHNAQLVAPVINSTMNRLRKKVEINPRHEYIVTERGKGYRLDLGQLSDHPG